MDMNMNTIDRSGIAADWKATIDGKIESTKVLANNTEYNGVYNVGGLFR